MQALFILAVLAADTSGRREPVLKSENLGGTWTSGVASLDLGLAVQGYYNQTLNRSETWHQSENGEWFLRVRDRLYVFAAQGSNGSWATQPSVRLVHRDGAWRRAGAL